MKKSLSVFVSVLVIASVVFIYSIKSLDKKTPDEIEKEVAAEIKDNVTQARLVLDGKIRAVGERFLIAGFSVRLAAITPISFTIEHNDMLTSAERICQPLTGAVEKTEVRQGTFLYQNTCDGGLAVEFTQFKISPDQKELMVTTKLYTSGL
ncbi:MAG TPA: hypothetical protein VI981_05570 [Candidatus Paceibacterota bacterium]